LALGADRILPFSRDTATWQKARVKTSGAILSATLTLLGLLIGFTFSTAISRYNQRKNDEQEEANAIGTEYVRADLLRSADAAKVRALLRSYTDQRILFYETGDRQKLL
jgi:hypothetical protein